MDEPLSNLDAKLRNQMRSATSTMNSLSAISRSKACTATTVLSYIFFTLRSGKDL